VLNLGYRSNTNNFSISWISIQCSFGSLFTSVQSEIQSLGREEVTESDWTIYRGGLEVLEKLKLDPETKAIPVIILTNLAGTQDAEAALAKGAVKYIIKSENEPKQVVNMVKEILAGYTRNEVPSITPTGWYGKHTNR